MFTSYLDIYLYIYVGIEQLTCTRNGCIISKGKMSGREGSTSLRLMPILVTA